MLRLTFALSLCLSLSACNTFFAEVSVERLCRQQAVRIEPDLRPGLQHLALASAFDVSGEVPGDDHLKLTLTLDHAQLTAVDGGTLPYVAHATLALMPPEGSALERVQLVDYHADAGTPQTTISAQCPPVEALQYARAGQLTGQLTLDVDVPAAPVDTTLEVCGALTARYDL